MRLIDADTLEEVVQANLRENPHKDGRERAFHYTEYTHFLDVIRRMPTITQPPNDPLPLEQLLKMNWEPAWVDGGYETGLGKSGWAILWYSKVEKYLCVWWPGEEYADIPALGSYGDTWTVYRHKPDNPAYAE